MGGLKMPNMGRLGLSNIKEIKGIPVESNPVGVYGMMQESSVGKDTMTGHWELMGLNIDNPFKVYPNGFPRELIDELEKRTGRKVIGNKPASGTGIIDELVKSIWKREQSSSIRRQIRSANCRARRNHSD